MKIVKFLGGLGNQMFQYAFYLALKHNHNRVKVDLSGFETYAKHNGYELEKVFGIKVKKSSQLEIDIFRPEKRDFVTRKLRRITGAKNAYREEAKDFEFEPQLLEDKSSRYYWGYWQNYNYFESIEYQLRNNFTFKTELIGVNANLKAMIESTNSVGLHVRRGDYVDDPILGNICTLSYYLSAINTIKTFVKDSSFVVFSDDISWCKQNLNLNSATFVDWNKAEDSYLDLQLLCGCKHLIISNSSFSWWAAWLNTNPNKIVVAPSKWAKY